MIYSYTDVSGPYGISDTKYLNVLR